MGFSLRELAAHVGGQIDGDSALQIDALSPLATAQTGQLSFYGNSKYKKALAATGASAVLVPTDLKGDDVPANGHARATWVRVAQPHLAFARIAQLFFPTPRFSPGIAPTASVHPSAQIDSSATVMAHATVEQGAQVGEGAVLFPGAYVGANARIGARTVLHPNAVVAAGCLVGADCILQPGSVVGSDGFGFAFDPAQPRHVKIPQAGIARLEDDVELGANSCVDRATLGETVIGRGTKIDNLVQVAHNVTIGPYSILCAQVGVSGSAQLGTGVTLGGQVGVAGHLHIGDLAKVAAQSGIAQDVDDGAELMGSPAFPFGQYLRSAKVFEKLPELAKELRALAKRIAELEKTR